MPTARAVDRLMELVEVATNLFSTKGYRRTQMADVTDALGLSQGAIYRYVESKDALFDLVVRAAAEPDFLDREVFLPVPTPEPGETFRFLRECVRREAGMPELEEALERNGVDDPAAEFEAIVRRLFETEARHRQGIRLLEKSALDWPELAELWHEEVRAPFNERLTAYLESRIEMGVLRPMPDPRAAARLITGLISTFAVHLPEDPLPRGFPDEVMEETVIDNLVHAYVIED